MNLNGRIFGRTADGMILVKLTVGEYLETLPEIEARLLAEAPVRIEKAPHVDPPAAVRKPAREPGKATPAQRRFNGTGRKPKAAKKKAHVSESKTCPHCGESYTPKRSDQTNCLKPDCRTKQKAVFLAAFKARKAAEPPSSTSTPPVDRIAVLKAVQARVAARQALGESPEHGK